MEALIQAVRDIYETIINTPQFLSSIFDNISNFFSTVVQYIANFVSSISYMVSILGSSVSAPFDLSYYVHPILSACILSVLILSVIKLLLGWGNQ